MNNVIKITEDLCFVGGFDRRLSLFENVYPVQNGMSYNSYLLTDEKTVLFDTADEAVSARFIENIQYALQGRKLDYIIVNHMEPDHCASLEKAVELYPDVKIVATAKAITMMKQFFDFDADSCSIAVKENDTLSTGKHLLTFITAPMVHWPEVMVTYDSTNGVLFSADAFGTFGAPAGSIFADSVDFEHEFLPEARRYYTNIVGKYGAQVNALLKKTSALEIKMLCPLHGYIWRENIDRFVDKYAGWASYTPEDNGTVIAYGSIYGGTENAAEILAVKLAELGAENIRLYDVSKTHPSYILSECFRSANLVFASSTYNGGIFTPMETLLLDIKAHGLKGRKVSIIENGSWAAASGNKIKEIVSSLPDTEIIGETVSIKSAVKDGNVTQLEELAKKIMSNC